MLSHSCFLLAGVLAFGPASNPAPTPESIRKSIEFQWQSIEDFRIECDEFIPDADGKPKTGSSQTHYEFVSRKDGAKHLRSIEQSSDHADRLLVDERENGRQRFELLLNMKTGEPFEVNITAQRSHGHAWDGLKFAALWLMLPDGKTPVQLLEAGAKLEVHPDGETATLSFMKNKLQVICELSGRHDWLVKNATIKSSSRAYRKVVDRFARIDGRWYPAAGHFDVMGPDGVLPTPFKFIVTKFRYNEHPDAKTFGMQEAPKGTLVVDVLTKKKYRIGMPNTKLPPKPESSPLTSEPITGEPLRIPTVAESYSTAQIIGYASMTILAFASLATCVRILRQHKRTETRAA